MDSRHTVCDSCYSKINPTNSCPYCRATLSNRVNVGSLFYSRPYDYHSLSCDYSNKVYKILHSKHDTHWLCWCTINTMYDCINSDNVTDLEKYLKSLHIDCKYSSSKVCREDITYKTIYNLTNEIATFNKQCNCGGFNCEIYWDETYKKISLIETKEYPTDDSEYHYEEYILDHTPTFREVIFDIIKCNNSSMLTTKFSEATLDDLVNSGKLGEFEYELGME